MECAATQNALIKLLGQLGFRVSWSKCSSPSTKCVFLGVEINSLHMTMSLPTAKLSKLLAELSFFRNKERATVKQMQRRCGIMSYAARVIRGGRVFSRCVIDLLKGPSPSQNVLDCPMDSGMIFNGGVNGPSNSTGWQL